VTITVDEKMISDAEDVGFGQVQRNVLTVEKLPLVMELRAEVSKLQDQLKRSMTVKNTGQSDDASLSAKNAASSNIISNEAETIMHLRRVIQVGSIYRNRSVIFVIFL